MTSSYISPAQAAGQQASWTTEQWAAFWVGHAEASATWAGVTRALDGLPPCTPPQLMYQLDIRGRTAADRAYRDMLTAVHRDAYDRATAAEDQVAS